MFCPRGTTGAARTRLFTPVDNCFVAAMLLLKGNKIRQRGMPSGGIGDVRAALKVRLLPSVTARLFLGHFWNVPPVGDFVPPNVPPRCPGWGRLFVEACGSETASASCLETVFLDGCGTIWKHMWCRGPDSNRHGV
jgi:hypothetical protein